MRICVTYDETDLTCHIITPVYVGSITALNLVVIDVILMQIIPEKSDLFFVKRVL